MTTIAAPAVHRQWNKVKPLNHYTNDFTNTDGVRVSTPLYVDVPTMLRKQAFNAIREACSDVSDNGEQTNNNVTVVSFSTNQPAIEAYLGMSLDVLRGVLFQRGGLALDLILRIQSVTGQTLISEKDLTAAFKQKHDIVKAYMKENPFNALG